MNPWPGRATISPAELAKAMGRHVRTIRSWIKSGKVRVVRTGSCIDIPIDEALRVTGNLDGALQATATELVRPAAPPVNLRLLTSAARAALRDW